MIKDMDIEPISDGLDKKVITDAWMENDFTLIGTGNKFGKWFSEDELEVDRRRVRYGELDRK